MAGPRRGPRDCHRALAPEAASVSPQPCLTVDVEDWYEGLAVLGRPIPAPVVCRSGLDDLRRILVESAPEARLTLFVVGGYARTVKAELAALVAAGHEIASHGPDHGVLPDDPGALEAWMRRGRQLLEDLLQVQVAGFRAPRFDLPPSMSLSQYRDIIAKAGFGYVSDRRMLGPASAVGELPVLSWWRIPVGGGSYQRLLPDALTATAVERAAGPVVLYYHSYDFGATLPPLRQARSWLEVKQLAGRRRLDAVFARVIAQFGSQRCDHVCAATGSAYRRPGGYGCAPPGA